MTIKELERITGLKRSTIRVYERMGLLKSKASPTNRYRAFDETHVERLGAIRMAQALGFSLRETAILIDAWEGGRMSATAKRAALAERLVEVEAKRRDLDALARWLKAILGWLDRGEQGEKPRLKPSSRRAA